MVGSQLKGCVCVNRNAAVLPTRIWGAPTQCPRWPGAKPFVASYSRRRKFWHHFVGLNRHPTNCLCFQGISCINQMARRAGSGFLHTYRTQLSQNSRPKHITAQDLQKQFDLARCAHFFQSFREIPGPVNYFSYGAFHFFRFSNEREVSINTMVFVSAGGTFLSTFYVVQIVTGHLSKKKKYLGQN